MKQRYKNFLKQSKKYDYFCYGLNGKANKIISRLKNNYLFYNCYCPNEKEKQEIIEKRKQEKKEYIRKQEEAMKKTYWGKEVLRYRLYKSNYERTYYNGDIIGNSYIYK